MGGSLALASSGDATAQLLAVLRAISSFLTDIEPTLRWLAEGADQLRKDQRADYLAFFGFGLFTVRKSLTALPSFFTLLLQKYPLPAYRAIGITDEHMVRVKEVILFYVLYLSYQVVQFPLTFGNSHPISFASDLLFQIGLAGYTLYIFRRVRDQIMRRWDDDPLKAQHVQKWLATSLDKINIRYDEMRENLLRVFVVSFLPALLTVLPLFARWLREALDFSITEMVPPA